MSDNVLAYDLDMAVSLFGTIVQGRIDEREEVTKNGQVVGHRPKYKTVADAIGMNTPKRGIILTIEDAIAAGFIPMGADGKPKKAG